MKEIEALGAIVTRNKLSEIQVCIFQRTDQRTNNKNLFEVALGGEFKEGEQPEDVLKRELAEKIKLAPLNVIYFGIVEILQNDILVKRHIFLCSFPDGTDPSIDAKKHQGFEWKKIDEVGDFSDFVAGAKEILLKAGLI